MTMANFQAALDRLRGGGVIALPTDTLYALAANSRDPDAVRRVYAIKGREDGKPLPLFVDGVAMAERLGRLNDDARRLAEHFWPGALTLVVRRSPDFDSAALAGGDTVALRAPADTLVRDLVRALDVPITGTSANRSGGPDPDTAAEVTRQLGDEVDLVIDGGRCPGGVPSTIVDCTGDDPKVLRAGAIAESEIHAALLVRGRA